MGKKERVFVVGIVIFGLACIGILFLYPPPKLSNLESCRTTFFGMVQVETYSHGSLVPFNYTETSTTTFTFTNSTGVVSETLSASTDYGKIGPFLDYAQVETCVFIGK